MSILSFIKSVIKKKKLANRSVDTIVFDDIKIQRNMANGHIEAIRWDEIEEICIITTDEGPLVDDLFWLMIGHDTGCAVPSESIGAIELINEFQKLPEFNNEEVIKAMSCTEKATFTCWKK